MHFNCYQPFGQPLCLCIQQSHALGKVQYPAEGDALQVTWFHKMLTRCLNLNAANTSHSERMCEAISEACLHLSHPGLSDSLSSNRCPFKQQCPVNSPILISSWFLIMLSNFRVPLVDGVLRKSLACLCP
jgi:hypothetical protein